MSNKGRLAPRSASAVERKAERRECRPQRQWWRGDEAAEPRGLAWSQPPRASHWWRPPSPEGDPVQEIDHAFFGGCPCGSTSTSNPTPMSKVRRKPRKKTNSTDRESALQLTVHPDAAGIDIGRRRTGGRRAARALATATPCAASAASPPACMPCATKLLACGIKTAALESTGHYGITTYARARGCGPRSLRLARPPASLFPSASSLVNARHLKGVPGKKNRRAGCAVAPATSRRWPFAPILPPGPRHRAAALWDAPPGRDDRGRRAPGATQAEGFARTERSEIACRRQPEGQRRRALANEPCTSSMSSATWTGTVPNASSAPFSPASARCDQTRPAARPPLPHSRGEGDRGAPRRLP